MIVAPQIYAALFACCVPSHKQWSDDSMHSDVEAILPPLGHQLTTHHTSKYRTDTSNADRKR